jgi:hypothetical protein
MQRTIILLLALSSALFAWRDIGHRAVARIALLNLDSATLAKIQPLLPEGKDLADLSTMADNAKAWKPESRTWHYIDLPVRKDITVKDMPLYYANDGKAGADIVSQMKKEINALKDPAVGKEMKKEALLFLVHFMGDLHMPMHCSNDDDRGGNDKKVGYFAPGAAKAKVMNLHALWDQLVEPGDTDDPVQLGASLNGKITPAQKAAWVKGSIEDWAFETYGIAKNTVYKGLKPGPCAMPFALPAGYHSVMRPIVDTQLERAGVRLAFVLETVFGK